MDFTDEHYVKLFTRDTPTWILWPWEARALLPLLMRKLDKAGMMDIGTREPLRALAVTVGLPLEVVEAGLPSLLTSGTAELEGGTLLVPRFNDAQESRKTNKASAREYREKRKATQRANHMGLLDPTVINRHGPSRNDEPRHPPALPCPSPALPCPSSALPCPPPPLPLPAPIPLNRPVAAATVTTEQPVVVVGDQVWERLQSDRPEKLMRERFRPKDFDEWAVRALASCPDGTDQLAAAYRRYLSDDAFRDRKWPMRIFMSDEIWQHRVPQEARA